MRDHRKLEAFQLLTNWRCDHASRLLSALIQSLRHKGHTATATDTRVK